MSADIVADDQKMQLNTISAALGHKKVARRVGRGIGSGLGKTCGRGHKGQKSRSGGGVRPGFEGGQMPLQKRLPKFGFTSRVGMVTEQVRTSELGLVQDDVISLETLKKANIVGEKTRFVKIFLSGDVTKAVSIQGLKVSQGARQAIEKAGGKIIEA